MEAKKREPLLRVVKHAELSKGQSVGLRILAVVLALIVGEMCIRDSPHSGYNKFQNKCHRNHVCSASFSSVSEAFFPAAGGTARSRRPRNTIL